MIQVVPVASFGRTMSEPRRPTELRRPVGSPNVSIRPVVPRVGSRDRHPAGRRRPVHACQPTPRRIRSGRLSRLHHGPKSSAASARGLFALPVVASSARAVARFRSGYTFRAEALRDRWLRMPTHLADTPPSVLLRSRHRRLHVDVAGVLRGSLHVRVLHMVPQAESPPRSAHVASDPKIAARMCGCAPR
jgi:hypothetical protein